MKAIGLELFAERPAEDLTVVKVPPGIDGNALLSMLEKQYGLRLSHGRPGSGAANFCRSSEFRLSVFIRRPV